MLDNKILRIMDVNVNRAREALRFIEDISRLYFNDKKTTLLVKKARHNVSKAVDKRLLVLFRDSGSDLGRKASFDIRSKVKLADLIIANLTRGQEALRMLEELSKMIKPSASRYYKEARFLLYDIEKKLVKKIL
jgi:thiamine-phosphate pyrophosphorylase